MITNYDHAKIEKYNYHIPSTFLSTLVDKTTTFFQSVIAIIKMEPTQNRIYHSGAELDVEYDRAIHFHSTHNIDEDICS